MCVDRSQNKSKMRLSDAGVYVYSERYIGEERTFSNQQQQRVCVCVYMRTYNVDIEEAKGVQGD